MMRDRDKRKKRTLQIILGVFIAFIMVFSIFEYSLMQSSDSSTDYKGHSFSQDPQSRMYLTEVDGKAYAFYSWPGYLEGIPVDPAVVPLLKSAQAVIYTFDPKGRNLQAIEQARYEFSTIIPIQPVFAVLQNDTAYDKLPIISCADAAPYMPVVLFNESSNLSIAVTGSCIVLNANNSDYLLVRDRLLYAYLGVMT